MSMYRSRNQRKQWRTTWPWRVLFPLRVDDRFCPKCELPFHEGPLPKEVTRYSEGNVTAFVFRAGTFRRDDYAIRFGRWKTGGKQHYCSEFIPAAEIDDVLAVVELAKKELAAQSRTRATRR